MSESTMRQRGFTLLELMVAVAVFTAIVGVAFALLSATQQRYQMETQYQDTFQSASVAVDQIARDIHSAGYPPLNSFTAATAAAEPQLVAIPFAWTPNYPGTPCTVNVNCTVPGPYDLILEANLSPQSGTAVQWIRYTLQGPTLFRGVATKTAGMDPAVATQPNLVPYLDNVMNNATPAQMALIQKTYPTMFPGNTPVPVFTYTAFDPGTPNQPPNIREVNITLIVLSPTPDPRTGQRRLATLTGQARRVNPNQ